MKKLLTIIAVLSWFPCTAQKLNYRKIKDTVCPSFCGWPDFEFVSEFRPKLLAIDTNQLLSKSLPDFYRDLALMEYFYYSFTLDTSAIRNSARCSVLVTYHDPKRYHSYRSAAQAFSYLKDCANTKYYLALYKENIPRRFYDENARKQVELLENICP